MLSTLRQPRYAALTILMVVIAGVCVLLGTWQIARLGQKVDTNDELRHNAHAAPAPVADVLPLVVPGKASRTPKSHKIEFRRVTATGTYDNANTVLARTKVVDGTTGYYVVTPLRTNQGTLLVARGFVENPTAVQAPTGEVTIAAWVHPPDSKSDQAAVLRDGQVESINPTDEAKRLDTSVFNAYVELPSGQPGVQGLKALPSPDLGNPAGGAVEPQHVAYIIQWYLFALLALAAPIAMARSETKHRETRDFDTHHDEPAREPAPEAAPSPEEVRAAKLADRYGKPVRR